MTDITKQQARKRFRALPKVLQDTLFSVQTSEVVNRVAEQNNAPESKISGIGESMGLVLLGFIHPEEVAKEIQERSGLNPQTAQIISTSLNARIFSSLQKEINLAYAPLPEEHYEPKSDSPSKPSRIVEEIKQLKETGSELVDVLRKREERTPVFPSGLKRPVDAPRTTTAPGVTSAPKSPMNIDFEKPAASPGPKFDFTQPAPAPTPPAKFSDGIPERATGDQGSPPPSGPRLRPGASAFAQGLQMDKPDGQAGGSEPMMIHKESKITPSAPIRSFHLEMPEDKMRERGSLMSEEKQPAKLDIGGMRKTPEGPAKTEVMAPKVIHYGPGQDNNKSPFGTPISPFEKPSPAGFKPELKNFPPPPPPLKSTFDNNFPKKIDGKDVLPIAELKSPSSVDFGRPKPKKPGWLSKLLRKSEPEKFLTKNDRPEMSQGLTPKQINYSATLENTPKPMSPEPSLPKKIDTIKSPVAPPPNLPVSSRGAAPGDEVIDLETLRKMRKGS